MSKSQVWLITGCSRGIGYTLAEAVLAQGHQLVATARRPEQLADFVKRYGIQVRAVALDVTDASAAKAAVHAAVSAFGRLDVLVNNAGYANLGAFEDVAADDFRAQMETNFFGVVNMTRAALPVMHGQRSGHVIQISSIGGRGASPGLAAYQAAKWAVGGFSGVVAREVAPLGIHVTTVEPGGMRTDWAGSSMHVDDLSPDYADTVGGYAKNVRGKAGAMRGDPKKIANAILKLAGEKNPPTRLLLGTDAVFLASLFAKQRADEDAAWRSLSTSTDFDGMVDFAETPEARVLTQRKP